MIRPPVDLVEFKWPRRGASLHTRARQSGGRGDAPGDLKGQRRRAKVLRSCHARISPSNHVRTNGNNNRCGMKFAGYEKRASLLERERRRASYVSDVTLRTNEIADYQSLVATGHAAYVTWHTHM